MGAEKLPQTWASEDAVEVGIGEDLLQVTLMFFTLKSVICWPLLWPSGLFHMVSASRGWRQACWIRCQECWFRSPGNVGVFYIFDFCF